MTFRELFLQESNYKLNRISPNDFLIMVNGKRVGNVGGDARPDVFYVLNLLLDKKYRGTGLIQNVIQDIANMFPKGLISDGRHRSDMATKMYEKIPGIKKKTEIQTLNNGKEITYTHIQVPNKLSVH